MLSQGMKVNFREPLLRQAYVVWRGTKIGQRICSIACHSAGVGVQKLFEFLGGVGGDPPRPRVRAALESHIAVVLGFESVLNHFELKLADGAQEHQPTRIGAKHLYRTLFAQLSQARLQLLGSERIF